MMLHWLEVSLMSIFVSLSVLLRMEIVPVESVEVFLVRRWLILINKTVSMMVRQWSMHVWILILAVPGVKLEISVIIIRVEIGIGSLVELDDVVVASELVRELAVELIIVMVHSWPSHVEVTIAME